MGSDIYLSWDKMSKADNKKQMTGFSIDAGKFGYLRASIGMINENKILRILFPDKFWRGKSMKYDFKKNYGRLRQAGIAYLLANLFGIEMPLWTEAIELGKLLTDKLQKAGFEVATSELTDYRYAVMWLDSLFDFFELGIKKQEENLNPKVIISW
jgi:hypothetical protein